MLFLIYKPPPLHGAALNGAQLMSFYRSKENSFINIGLSGSSSDIGKFRLDKIRVLLTIILEIVRELLSGRHTKIYFSHTIRNSGFYRDLIIISLIKIISPKVRMVYHIHNCSNRIESSSKLVKRFLYSSAKVIYLSDTFYSSSFPSTTKLYTLPNYTEFSIKTRNELSCFSLVCLANFDVFKGINTLLLAFQRLVEVSFRYHLTLVGAEGDISLDELRDYIDSLGIESNVTIYHKISHVEVQRVLLNSSIMILSSEDEAMPMSLIEGCSLGLALISTDVGATREIVNADYNGYIIDGSAESIIEKVLHYKNQPDLLKMHSFNSIRLAKEKFNKLEYFKALNKILDE